MSIPADSAALLERIPLNRERLKKGCSFFTARCPDQEELERSFFLPGAPKTCDIQKAELTIEERQEGEELVLTITADKPVFYLFIESPRRRLALSDNLLQLLPGEPVEVRLSRIAGEGGIPVKDELLFHSLRNY